MQTRDQVQDLWYLPVCPSCQHISVMALFDFMALFLKM